MAQIILTEAEREALIVAVTILELRDFPKEAAVLEQLLARAGAEQEISNEARE